MAITRTPIINDDGTCTTGTVWDNAWKTELYDQIDAAHAVTSSPMRLGPAWRGGAPGGTINDWNLASLGKYTAYIVTPAANLTITGIVAEPDMSMYLLVNASAVTITLAQFNPGSSAANKFFCPQYTNYVMQPWNSVWLLYDVTQPAWIVLKP